MIRRTHGRSSTAFRAMLALLLVGIAPLAGAVVLDDDRRISVKLDDGTDVVLYGEAGGSAEIGYYYLPPRLTVAISDDGRPEFLFMKFITGTNRDGAGLSGALLHFLVKWGLTAEQEAELREIVAAEHDGVLKGAAPLFAAAGEDPGFSIVSATLQDGERREQLVSSGAAPLMPGGKAAAAAKLDAVGAQLLAKTFDPESTITDVTAVFNLAYETQLPAARGQVVIDWSRIEQEIQRIEAEYSRTHAGREKGNKGCFLFFCTTSESNVYEYSYDEMRDEYSYLMEQRYITFEFEERVADERVEKIREAFINYFINSMSQPAEAPAADRTAEDDEEGDGDDLGIRTGAHYTYNVDKIKTGIQRGRQVFRMDYKLTLRWPLQVVGNLKSWYAEVASDPHAVQSVVLDDPMFEWRDILFLIDAEDKDLYGSEINFTTINVRKQRPDGSVFEDAITIDEAHLRDKGTRAVLNYARGADPDSGTYEYKVQMSFRGGKRWPEHPAWQRGDWEGVSIAAPLARRAIELEADLAELEAAGVTRVTAQIRYPKLGEEAEQNIQLSVAGGEPLVGQQIFMNNGAEGYVYRLIFNHREAGRLATPWSKRTSDDYIYAAVPEELRTDLLEEAAGEIVDAAKRAVVAEAGDQLARFNILLGEDES
ncbi:MAG TPA: hypothetical protein VF200_13190 [Woeseiaceae bacterium]